MLFALHRGSSRICWVVIIWPQMGNFFAVVLRDDSQPDFRFSCLYFSVHNDKFKPSVIFCFLQGRRQIQVLVRNFRTLFHVQHSRTSGGSIRSASSYRYRQSAMLFGFT